MAGRIAAQEPGGDAPILHLLDDKSTQLIKQGAEAKVYRAALYTNEPTIYLPGGQTKARPAHTEYVLIKHRFFKRYRHPALSTSVTASRTISEARSLVRCARSGVHVPRLAFVDETRGILGMEWIDGPSVRQWLGGIPEVDEAVTNSTADPLPSDEEQCTYRIDSLDSACHDTDWRAACRNALRGRDSRRLDDKQRDATCAPSRRGTHRLWPRICVQFLGGQSRGSLRVRTSVCINAPCVGTLIPPGTGQLRGTNDAAHKRQSIQRGAAARGCVATYPCTAARGAVAWTQT